MLPLEDNYGDIVGKAMRGLDFTDLSLAQAAKLTVAEIRAARKGDFAENTARKIAAPLKLRPAALIASGQNSWHPQTATINQLEQFTSNYGHGMTVNSYLVWNTATHEAALFDTGTNPQIILDFLANHALTLKLIFLTHTHGDHIDCLTHLQKATQTETWVHKNGDIGGVKLFDWGKTFQLANLKIETRQTTGHAADGTTYVVYGLAKPIAIVGDAVFAGSMGGGMISYVEALATNLKSIYSLTDETLLCPGHGPLTTVSLEKQHNPFYQPAS